MLPRAAVLSLTALATFLAAAGASAQVIISNPVEDPLALPGQGLCVASAVSMTPSIDFNLTAATYNQGVNQFMAANKAIWSQYVQQTIFDLSNNDASTNKASYGDFLDSMMPMCAVGGCPMYVNDTTTSYASRFRGFLNVTSKLANLTDLHIGFYADDAVSLTIFDSTGNAHAVITQPPVLGAPTWRTTEAVQFTKPGMYPIEILYVQIVEHAALEMSFFIGNFTDFQRPAFQVPIVNLSTSGYTLFDKTAFFQTLSGQPSYPDLAKCEQCDRQFVGSVGNNGCDPGYYCNQAALCAPCDTALLCGPSCSPCGGMTPFCINENGQEKCAGCRTDSDCKPGFSCDPTTHVCNECNTDTDCPQGKECVKHVCDYCNAPDKCAGSSCNCCGQGKNGQQMACAKVGSEAFPECVECKTDADCTEGGVCDVLIGQCVPEHAQNEKTSCCGPACLTCPAQDPLCLPGPFGTACAACRNDLECPKGSYCLAGQCSLCDDNRRCGPRCEACGGDTPFCTTAQVAEDAKCVRCTDDAACAGGTCDKSTHECSHGCAMTCAPATPFCNGETCVACFADTQCPCGGTCNLATFTCSTSCESNKDCLGDQHCEYTPDGKAMDCAPGPLPDNTACGSTLANACSGNSIGARGTDPTPPAGVAALSILALGARWAGRRRRGLR